MRSVSLNLIYALGLVAVTMVAMPEVEGFVISNGQTVTVPPPPNDDVEFTAPLGGTLIVNANYQGDISCQSSPSLGTVIFNADVVLNGSVLQGVAPVQNVILPFLQNIGNPNPSFSVVEITGIFTAKNISLGPNTLLVDNGLQIQSDGAITTVVGEGVINCGNINLSAITQNNLPPEVTINIEKIIGNPNGDFFVVQAQGGGSSGSRIIVNSSNPFFLVSGQNSQGNITITVRPNSALISSGVAQILLPLLSLAASNPNSDIAVVIDALAALPTVNDVIDAVLQFVPPVDGALPRMSFNSAKQFQQLWGLHMTNGRCVYAKECADDYYLLDENGEYVNQDGMSLSDVQEECNSSIYCDSVLNRWEVWADGFGMWGHQDSYQIFNGSRAFGYRAHLYGGMLAAQGPICRDLSGGFGGGYAQTHVQRDHSNHSTIRAYDATVYLSYNPTHWYLDAAFSFDYNHYDDLRHIKFPGIDRTAKADYNGLQYTGLLAGGYRFYKWCTIFTPLASIQYSRLNVEKYHEHGAKDLDLHVKKQHYNFVESSLGLKIARPIQTESGAFVPEVHGIWLHDYHKNTMHLKGNFSGAAEEGTFFADGPGMAKNRGDVGVGITFLTCSDLSVEAVYNYEFSKKWHANEALIKISQRF